MSLASLTTPRRVGDRYEITMPAGWLLGRGVFGGLTFAAFVRAIEDFEGDATRRLRSLTIEIYAPVEPGVPSEIVVTRLRRGNNVSALRAELFQRGESRAHAVGILASPRGSAMTMSWQDLVPPAAPSWRTIPQARIGPPIAPEFIRNFQFYLVEGMPHTGAAAHTVGWIRPVVANPVVDASYIAAIIDAWWPAAMVRFPAPRPLATLAFTLEIVGDLADLDPEVPLLYRGGVPVCSDGYFVETRELWSEAGRLIARNHQTFAVIQ